jgi:hypothetical protein
MRDDISEFVILFSAFLRHLVFTIRHSFAFLFSSCVIPFSPKIGIYQHSPEKHTLACVIRQQR